MKTLLTPLEIIDLCALPKQFPAFDLRAIKSIEYDFFRKNLTLATYEVLLAAMQDYTQTTAWSASTAYVVDDIVKRDGVAYVALADNIDLRPPNSAWATAPKILVDSSVSNAECINTIWCDGFLSETLAWACLLARLPFIGNQIHAEGVGNTLSDKFQKANIEEFRLTASGVKSMYETSFGNFTSWVEANKCFITLDESDCCCGEKNKVDSSDYWLRIA